MRRVIFQSYTLVGNPAYKDAFEWSLRSWSEWCKYWGIAHYVRSEVYNIGDTQFVNQMGYEPNSGIDYDLGVLVDCFTAIHPRLHPDAIFSDEPYVNLTEGGIPFLSVIAGSRDRISALLSSERVAYGERDLFERDRSIMAENVISNVRHNSVDVSTVEERHIMPTMGALLFQPCIVRFSNNEYDKLPNIYWAKCCSFVDKGLY